MHISGKDACVLHVDHRQFFSMNHLVVLPGRFSVLGSSILKPDLDLEEKDPIKSLR
jgi:hypothetical protein